MSRARLLWCCRRGMKELDLPLRRYLDEVYDHADPDEQAAFARLLDESDDSLWRYFYSDRIPEEAALAGLVGKIRRLPLTPA